MTSALCGSLPYFLVFRLGSYRKNVNRSLRQAVIPFVLQGLSPVVKGEQMQTASIFTGQVYPIKI